MESGPEKKATAVDILLQERRKALGDLHALAELLNLTVRRESQSGTTPTIVVEGANGKEVHIGYPEGGSTKDGRKMYAAATGKIPNIPMGIYGHGEWKYSIEI